MVKVNAYKAGATAESNSALATLNWSFRTFLRLFAPFIPFVTEEIWSWRYKEESLSIHKAVWPTPDEVAAVAAPVSAESFAAATEVISKVRGFKTSNKVSQKRPAAKIEVRGMQTDLDAVKLMTSYIMDSTNAEIPPVLIADETVNKEAEAGRFKVTVELGEYKE
jgi:valyl-tRNA synthetase